MDKIGLIVKKNIIAIVLSVIAIALYIVHQDSFSLIILIYGWFLNLLMSDFLNENVRKYIKITLWSSCAIVICLIYYVNHYMPHGPSYATGDVVCANGDRGPCGEEYKEDMTNLAIPEWAKLLKGNSGIGFILALVIAGAFASSKKEEKNHENVD